MNLNQNLFKKRLKDVSAFKNFNKNRSCMGPPLKPAPRKKTISTPSSATNWGRSLHSVTNSSALRTSSNSSALIEAEPRTIMAITEGRGEARCEVGIASIDTLLPTLILCQISDSQSYIKTLTKINILNPTEIIVPATFMERPDNRLVNALKRQFPNANIVSAARKTFNKNNGMDQISQLSLVASNTICVSLQHKYYALAAASALFFYLQSNLGIYYVNQSININYQESEGHAIIDVSTADRLELVSCTKPSQASRHSSLFGVLNHCITKIGARSLRSAILQPLYLPALIESRLLCVTELIKNPQMLLSIQAFLQKISNVDQLLTLTTIQNGYSWSTKQLNYILLLNKLVDLIDPLKDILINGQQPFFRELKTTLASENFMKIKNQIREMIHPSAHFARSEAGIHQRCFAIKPGLNGLLDMVRTAYAERLDDMKEYVKHLGNKYHLPLILNNNNSKSYHIVLKLSAQQKRSMKKSDLPSEFIQVYRLAGSFTMKTLELINFTTRIEDIMMEILKISNTMIDELIAELKQYIGFFYKLCEDLANLDMLQSLAEASLRGKYTRPKFGQYTELVQARHPLLDYLINERLVPNSISICQDFNIQMITGPNGSGKSIYIRQVMLLQVMAQIGCYVPAESAQFRPADQLFARIYLEDNMEYGASTFILELKEIQYMLSLISDNSLFIIDELCRCTSVEEGTALAMAICEKLTSSGAFVYITTHYVSLTKLRDMYLNIKTWQMETIATGDTPEELHLNYLYKLMPGVTQLKHYGVYIVKNIWPQSVRDGVYAVLETLKSVPKEKNYRRIDESVRLKYKLESDFRKLKSRGKLTNAEINKRLNDYANQLQKCDMSIALPDDLNTAEFEPNNVTLEQFNVNNNCFGDSETSSYRNLSNFIREDSDNINKLVPEILLTSHNEELSQPMSSLVSSNSFCSAISSVKSQLSIQQDMEVEFNFNGSSTSSNKDLLNKTNLVISGDCEDIDMESIAEDLEAWNSCQEEDFPFTQESVYNTPNEYCQHIFPEVRVVNGPFSPSSVNSSVDQGDFTQESISYSPLCSQIQTTPRVMDNTAEGQVDGSDKLESASTSNNKSRTVSSSLKETDDSDLSADKKNKRFSTKKKKQSESSSSSTSKSLRLAKRFIPPKKLTRKEIQEEFDEQDRKLLENFESNSDVDKYLSLKFNRPSVKQVQNSKHLAFVRRTNDGVEVIPVKDAPKKAKGFRFPRMLSSRSDVDVSIFSDQNAKTFEEFVNSKERDVKRFNFSRTNSTVQNFDFNPQGIAEYSGKVANCSFAFDQVDCNIDDIVHKYLQSNSPNVVRNSEFGGSIFENSIYDNADFDL